MQFLDVVTTLVCISLQVSEGTSNKRAASQGIISCEALGTEHAGWDGSLAPRLPNNQKLSCLSSAHCLLSSHPFSHRDPTAHIPQRPPIFEALAFGSQFSARSHFQAICRRPLADRSVDRPVPVPFHHSRRQDQRSLLPPRSLRVAICAPNTSPSPEPARPSAPSPNTTSTRSNSPATVHTVRLCTTRSIAPSRPF